MATCDLSSQNPNVLFELGLRQAFDKPTVLVQEVGTPRIFDIAPLRYTEYRKELRYREVLEYQAFIAQALAATLQATNSRDGINSIVRILSLSQPASLKASEGSESNGLLQLVRAEMSEMRSDFQRAMYTLERNSREYLGRPDGSSSARMAEAKDMLMRAEMMLSKETPVELIVETVNRAQKLVSRYLDAGAPSRHRAEAQELFALAEALERRLVEQQKRI